MLNHMKLVNYCLAIRKVVFYAFSETKRHITCDYLYVFRVTLVLLEIICKLVNSRVILPIGGVDHFSLRKIDHYSYVIVAFLTCFIHADAVNLGVILEFSGGINIMLNETP